MTDPFATLIDDARVFLSELARNNRREWFSEHRQTYESDLKSPALLFLDQVAHDLGRRAGYSLIPKLFRPHRDVRFSKDKTPYHTHLHMLWSLNNGADQTPSLFLGISPEYVRVGGGIMGFDKPTLIKWRAAMYDAVGADFQTDLDALAAQGLALEEPDLKRVPAPFDKDHPRAQLLRRKGLTLWRDVAPPRFASPQLEMAQLFGDLFPVLEKLRQIL